ncbi:TrkA family potassium uptake protein [Aquibacillus sp. 3ASR75-11]|uniref:TrkA family potassium uptake protein n=1 Tax=Terrihalobacillus insolitus TaxID=2950438 RepID=A0A9X3WUG4_9BACI|nr:TrkA family potassium uptake protein [Terrihalobacillus insolitus]MDC3414686.1 TrkA family potassium uptake protein [Terrihalobacillus insolitus]MDC3424201.1 TrkA family potassium uptake protein [Terrihalobacillus insolitus]
MKTEKKEFVIIGLGRFGGSLCKELTDTGIEVLAIDKNRELVQEYASIASHAVVVDAIDEGSLNSLGIRNFDCAIISLGDDLESSILATLLLKEMGMKQIWVKARNENHQKVLERIGADRIIHPERDMAKRIAHHIVSDKIVDYIELSKNHSIVEVVASDKIAGKNINDIHIYEEYNCNIIAVKKNEHHLIMLPSPNEKIVEGDILILMGENSDLNRLEVEGV